VLVKSPFIANSSSYSKRYFYWSGVGLGVSKRARSLVVKGLCSTLVTDRAVGAYVHPILEIIKISPLTIKKRSV